MRGDLTTRKTKRKKIGWRAKFVKNSDQPGSPFVFDADLRTKTELSLRQVRDQLWKVHEAHLRDDRTGKVHILRTNTADWANTALGKLLGLEFAH